MIKKGHLWKELFEKIEITTLDANDDFSLKVTNKFQIFIEHKLLEKKLGITNFSRMVEKQFKIEKQLNEMIDNIRSLKLRIIEHKRSYILAKQDDIVQQLDENFNMLIFMKSSPYIKPVINKANYMEYKLLLI